ncbi:MAG TPA: hypothetical protein VFO82_03600 [Steroidobacteraceae bacterium]|nr:hypothetical protein [Steroidobacteraceae bacterium]
MRVAFLVCCLSISAALHAAGTDKQMVIQELGAVLAWRLGPEAIEGRCRNADPDGAAARKAALDSWRQKNDERIKAVDKRVAEVVPLLKLPLGDGDPVQAVHKQIETMLLELAFASKGPEETRAYCKEEADPARPRWNDTGMPHIQLSLAALYDWQQTQQKQP